MRRPSQCPWFDPRVSAASRFVQSMNAIEIQVSFKFYILLIELWKQEEK